MDTKTKEQLQGLIGKERAEEVAKLVEQKKAEYEGKQKEEA